MALWMRGMTRQTNIHSLWHVTGTNPWETVQVPLVGIYTNAMKAKAATTPLTLATDQPAVTGYPGVGASGGHSGCTLAARRIRLSLGGRRCDPAEGCRGAALDRAYHRAALTGPAPPRVGTLTSSTSVPVGVSACRTHRQLHSAAFDRGTFKGTQSLSIASEQCFESCEYLGPAWGGEAAGVAGAAAPQEQQPGGGVTDDRRLGFLLAADQAGAVGVDEGHNISSSWRSDDS